jgi:hypothetical protein
VSDNFGEGFVGSLSQIHRGIAFTSFKKSISIDRNHVNLETSSSSDVRPK